MYATCVNGKVTVRMFNLYHTANVLPFYYKFGQTWSGNGFFSPYLIYLLQLKIFIKLN